MRKFFKAALLSSLLACFPGLSHAYQYEGGPVAMEAGYAVPSVQPCLSAESCEECCSSWLDNSYVWIGADNYKSIGERITNINGGTGALTSSPGLVTGFNKGFGLGDSNIRGQFGASFGAYDPRGRIQLVPNQNTAETQVFITTGFYKNADECDPISWGAVVDYFSADDWGVNACSLDLFQFRGIFGYALNECVEVGVWGTANMNDDLAAVTVAGAPGVRRPVRAMDQANVYIKRTFEYGGQLTFYTGVVDNADIGDWQIGLLGQAPLGERLSLYANVTYVAPSSSSGPTGSGEEQYNFGIGLAWYFGGSGAPGLPLLNVANNGSFLITD